MQTIRFQLFHIESQKDIIALLFFAVGIVAWFGVGVLYRHFPNDFSIQEYAAGRSVLEGQPIYNGLRTTLDKAFERENFHPPPAIIVFLPLSILPYELAVKIYSVLMLTFLCSAIALALSPLKIRFINLLGIIGLSLCSSPAINCAATLNYSPLIALLVVLGWRACAEKNECKTGIYIGLATALKIYPALLVVPLLFAKRFKSLGWLIVSIVVIEALTLVILDLNQCIYYYKVIMRNNIVEFGAYPINFSISAIVYSAFVYTPWSQPLFELVNYADLLVLSSRLILLSLLLIALNSLKDKASAGQKYAITLGFMLLIVPISWSHGLFVLIVPTVELIKIINQNRSQCKFLILILICALILFAMPDRDFATALSKVYSGQVPWAATLLARLPAVGIIGLISALYYGIKNYSDNQFSVLKAN